MVCKYCNRDMLEGFIPTQVIHWIPKNGKMKFIYNDNKTEGFRIGRTHQLSMKKQPAWYCPTCDIILIECDKEGEAY